jgi:hypothetical protein
MARHRQARDRVFYVDSNRPNRNGNCRSAVSACDCCAVNWHFPNVPGLEPVPARNNHDCSYAQRPPLDQFLAQKDKILEGEEFPDENKYYTD